jgi:ActR/RegA family two-component response regulator
MSTLERRLAAKANQRAAAFVRFQMLGDPEAMHVVLSEAGESDHARLAFVTALASIAASAATTALGRDGALDYLQNVATSSAALSEAEDIDRYFD